MSQLFQPSAVRVKASFVPSGDHAGSKSVRSAINTLRPEPSGLIASIPTPDWNAMAGVPGADAVLMVGVGNARKAGWLSPVLLPTIVANGVAFPVAPAA